MKTKQNQMLAIAVLGFAGAVSPAWADETSLAYSHDLAKQGGKLCMVDHFHTGSGEGSTKAAARSAAIRSWASFTNFEYGSSWASFANAAGSTTSYVKEASGWGATVNARPCRR